MGIITFSDEIFTTDSGEYEILSNAAAKIKGVSGAVVEIGTRRGGSAKVIIDSLVKNEDTNRSMFCIDPYGNIDYAIPESNALNAPLKLLKLDYDNSMRNQTIPSLYYYAYAAGLNFTFFCLEDTEFFARYADGVPVYHENKKLETDYAFVFFDGLHTNESVAPEVEFFNSRTPIGAVYVFDDVYMYHHDAIEKIVLSAGFHPLERGNYKASYQKVR